MKEAVGFWLEFIGEMVIIAVIILAGAHMIREVSSAKLAQAETNYTVEINEQDGSAVVYVENYEAITEDKDGLRIKKKGEE